jgi:hypothetical protein
MPGRAVDDHLRERDRGLGAVADIGVVIGEVLCLLGDGIGDLLAAIADIDAIEAGKGVEAFAARRVGDVDAFAAGNDAGRRLAARMHAHMGRGMEEVVAVPGVQFVAEFCRACSDSLCLCSMREKSRPSGGRVDAEIFELGEGFEAVARALAADAGLLPAAEGMGRR